MKTVEFYKADTIDLPFQFHYMCTASKEENINRAKVAASKASLLPHEVNYVVGLVRTHGDSISKLASVLGAGDRLLFKVSQNEKASKDAAFSTEASKAQSSIDGFLKSCKRK